VLDRAGGDAGVTESPVPHPGQVLLVQRELTDLGQPPAGSAGAGWSRRSAWRGRARSGSGRQGSWPAAARQEARPGSDGVPGIPLPRGTCRFSSNFANATPLTSPALSLLVEFSSDLSHRSFQFFSPCCPGGSDRLQSAGGMTRLGARSCPRRRSWAGRYCLGRTGRPSSRRTRRGAGPRSGRPCPGAAIANNLDIPVAQREDARDLRSLRSWVADGGSNQAWSKVLALGCYSLRPTPA
jgi:hypothetical protein